MQENENYLMISSDTLETPKPKGTSEFFHFKSQKRPIWAKASLSCFSLVIPKHVLSNRDHFCHSHTQLRKTQSPTPGE